MMMLDEETAVVSRSLSTCSSDNFQTDSEMFQSISSMYTNNSVLQLSSFFYLSSYLVVSVIYCKCRYI